jgi:hypothetical protein
MNALQVYDQALRQRGLRGLLGASAMLAALVAAGVSILVAPVQVVASGVVDKQQHQSQVKDHKIGQLTSMHKKDRRDLARLQAVLETCQNASAAYCSVLVNEPRASSPFDYGQGSSPGDDDVGNKQVVIHRVTERTTVRDSAPAPAPSRSKQPTPQPTSNPIEEVTKPATDAVDKATKPVKDLLDTATKVTTTNH